MKTSLLLPSLLVGLVGVGAGCSRTTPAPASAADTPRVARTAAPVQAQAPATSMDPCAILDLSDVRQVLPDAQAGVRDRGDEANGVMLCNWTGAGGRVSLQLHDSPQGAIVREVQELALGLVDLKNPKAADAVRVEAVPKVGDATFAVAEKVAAGRGIRRADAVVATQKGFRVVIISAPVLAAGDRTVALSKLTGLAQAAVAKL
ncbi:DUF3558 family protein [Lysobacter xanthus]